MKEFKASRGDMLYLHESVHLVPGLLNKCITQLNGDAFNDSIGDEKQSGSSAIGSELAKLASAKKRKHTARRTDTVGTAVVAMSKDTKAQNKTQKYAFIIDSKKTIIDAIAECRKEKRKALVQEAEDRGCSLFEMKKGFDDYKKWIENSKY